MRLSRFPATEPDGIRYVSRQRNDAYAYAYAIFERSGLRVKASRPLTRDALDALCDRYDVVEIRGSNDCPAGR